MSTHMQYSILDGHNIQFDMDYEKLCNDVLNLGSKVRFVGVCDNTGEIKNGGLREGIKSILTDRKLKRQTLSHYKDGGFIIHLLTGLVKQDTLWKNMKRLNRSQCL